MIFKKLRQKLPENQVLLLLQRTAPVRDKNTDAIITAGRVLPSEENIRTILKYDSRIADSIAYNVFADRLLYEGQEINDEILTELRFWLADEYNMRNKYGNLVDAGTLETVLHWYGRQKKIDPLADYLNGLKWDGIPRLHLLFSKYFDSENTELIQEIGVKWAVSCVARGLVGGAKVDTVLVLVGKQGVKKSSALRTLAGLDWFSDSHLDIRSKEAYQLIHSSGVWIWELAELQAIKTRDAENVKMFLSSQRDRYRPSYGRLPVTKDRRVIFTATTNEVSFLSDDENRRFLPIQVGNQINIDALREDRDQLWAEAVALYKDGSTWWLDDKYNDDLKEYQTSFHIEDPWEAACKKGLEDPQDEGVTIDEILNILELPQHQRHKGTVMRIAKILQRMGCNKKQTRIPRNGVTGRYYVYYRD
jgi:putative DNA primase/helicase